LLKNINFYTPWIHGRAVNRVSDFHTVRAPVVRYISVNVEPLPRPQFPIQAAKQFARFVYQGISIPQKMDGSQIKNNSPKRFQSFRDSTIISNH